MNADPKVTSNGTIYPDAAWENEPRAPRPLTESGMTADQVAAFDKSTADKKARVAAMAKPAKPAPAST